MHCFMLIAPFQYTVNIQTCWSGNRPSPRNRANSRSYRISSRQSIGFLISFSWVWISKIFYISFTSKTYFCSSSLSLQPCNVSNRVSEETCTASNPHHTSQRSQQHRTATWCSQLPRSAVRVLSVAARNHFLSFLLCLHLLPHCPPPPHFHHTGSCSGWCSQRGRSRRLQSH